MNQQNGSDLFDKKFSVERPVSRHKGTKNKSFYKSILTDQTNPKNNANFIGILATVAGYLGIHDYYCGNYRNGTLKFIFSFFGFLLPISVVWSIIDCYRIGNGTYKPQRNLPLVAAPWCKKVALAEAIFGFAVIVLIFRQVVKFFMGI